MPKPKINRLFWDIETSPNIGFFWRSGYKLNIGHENIIQERAIICICYKWENEKKVHSLSWKNGCDKKLIKEFLDVLSNVDELVAHNGDKFDMKWFRTRCLKHGYEVPIDVKTVDTLKMARSKFNFNSNRLDYIAKFLLGTGKIATGYDLWKNIVLHKCSKSMKKMVTYCANDVKILQQVYEELSKSQDPKTHVGVLNGKDPWSCPRCGSEEVQKYGNYISGKGIKSSRMKCKSCGCVYKISQTNAKKYLEEKNK
jgi:rubredoxin